MDLALTRRGEYAVGAALCLARVGGDGRCVKIREVAVAMDLPSSYTRRCCGCWRRGADRGQAGREGDYRLLQGPERISVLRWWRWPRARCTCSAGSGAAALPLGPGLRGPWRLERGGGGLAGLAAAYHLGWSGGGRRSAPYGESDCRRRLPPA